MRWAREVFVEEDVMLKKAVFFLWGVGTDSLRSDPNTTNVTTGRRQKDGFEYGGVGMIVWVKQGHHSSFISVTISQYCCEQ